MNFNAEHAKGFAKSRRGTVLRSSGRTLVISHLNIKAMPPDVRKGSAAPKRVVLTGASSQFNDTGSQENSTSVDGGAETPLHIRCPGRIRLRTLALTISFVFFSFIVCSCKRETRQFQHGPTETKNFAVTLSDLRPGAPGPEIPTKNPAEASAYAVSEGKRLYTAYNCSGCHFNGGGGIGPALMDEKWIYGSDPANIYATIVEGRPNGMPSFRHKISDYQVWELTAYVRSLSGQLTKDVSPTRSDDMNVHKSEQASEQKTPQNSGVPKSAEQP